MLTLTTLLIITIWPCPRGPCRLNSSFTVYSLPVDIPWVSTGSWKARLCLTQEQQASCTERAKARQGKHTFFFFQLFNISSSLCGLSTHKGLQKRHFMLNERHWPLQDGYKSLFNIFRAREMDKLIIEPTDRKGNETSSGNRYAF